jgi:hypothetical protein
MANNEEKMALLDNIETVEAQIEQAEELINDLRKELDQLKAEAEEIGKWPQVTKIYLHASKEEMIDKAEELGLEEGSDFRYTCYEVTLTCLVDRDGTCKCTHLNGMELKEPVEV